MIANIRKYLISGLLVWLPIIITILIIKFIVDLLSKSLLLLPYNLQPDVLFGFHVPGIGVLLTIVVILITGLIAANYMGQRMFRLGEKIMARIPLVRSIYTGVKQVTETVLKPGGQSFRKVLLVEFPCPGVWSLAFQTSEVTNMINGYASDEPMISYFIPTTPNPTSGFLMMAPKNKIKELDISVDQALKFVISLGVVQPETTASANKTPLREV